MAPNNTTQISGFGSQQPLGLSDSQFSTWMQGQGLGANLPTLSLGFQGLGALGSLYSDISQIGLAKKAFNFQKQYASANYANQAKSYNTALADRATSRGVQEGQSSSQVNDYIKNNSISTTL